MSKKYPRKQTVIIFVVCLAIVISAMYYSSKNNQQNNTSIKSNIGLTTGYSTSSESLKIDSSAFSDWKKQFASSTIAREVGKIDNKELTQTDRLGRELFTKFVELNQADLLNDNTVITETANNLISSNIAPQESVVYTDKDLKIISSKDLVSLNNFSIAVANAINEYSITKNESTIIGEYLSNSDPNVLKGIDPIIANYKKIISSLLAIPTPQIMVTSELRLINAYSVLLASATDLRTMGTDPVRGLSGISSHITGAKEIISSIKEIYDNLKLQGVDFNFNQEIMNVLLK